MVYKAEALEKGLNVRFVVTTGEDGSEALYIWSGRRGGSPELCIKELKEGCFADRLSCRRFRANQFRLLLPGAASWLLDTIRRWLAQLKVPIRSWGRCSCGCSRWAAGPGSALTR